MSHPGRTFGRMDRVGNEQGVIGVTQSVTSPKELGVDLEAGSVDGQVVGTYMANVALRLRRLNPEHYVNRADPRTATPVSPSTPAAVATSAEVSAGETARMASATRDAR